MQAAQTFPIPRYLFLTCTIVSTQIFRIFVRGFREINCLLNDVKTHSMIIGPPPNLRRLDCDDSSNAPLFQVNEEKVESAGNIKYLGAVGLHEG